MQVRKLLAGLLSLLFISVAAGPALAYDEGAVANGGTIEGKVTFNGAVATQKIIPTKDQETCGDPREEPVIRVGADKGVQDAVVYLAAVSKGKAWPPQGKAPALNNVRCRFEPAVQVIHTGALDVVNKDPVLHNTHGYYGKRTAFNMALPNKDQAITADLPRAGVVRVDCDAHGWMEGWIYVVDNPYYALSGEDGKFKITDVPPGEYELMAVQSSTKTFSQKVTVAAGTPTTVAIELKK